MSVHNWLASFAVGEARPIPTNCNFRELHDYARTRFGFELVLTPDMLVKRVCPFCFSVNSF